MEGPRAIRVEELPSLARLVDRVFMNGQDGAMFRLYPTLFQEGNLDNCLAFVEEGRVVSHVGMVQRWACLAGCTVRVACVGSVSTYEECRGRGLATRLFQASCDKALADGVDFMMISGGRTLYRRAGAADVGQDWTALVERMAANVLHDPAMHLVEPAGDDWGACSAAYDRRYARFLRPVEDWQGFRSAGAAMCRDVEIAIVQRNGITSGYFVVGKPDKDGVAGLIEFAGEETALAGALKPLSERRECRTLKIRLQQEDRILKTLLERAGVALQPVATSGTLLLLNFAQLMQRLRPFIEARIGTQAAARLSFRETNGQFAFSDSDNTIEVSGTEAAQVIFGHPDRGALPGLLADVFPVPTLWYGINYI